MSYPVCTSSLHSDLERRPRQFFRTMERLTVREVTGSYRKVQLLAVLINDLQRKSMTTELILFDISGQSVCLTSFLRGNWSGSFEHLLVGTALLAFSGITYIIGIIYVSGLASIYVESKKLRKKMGRWVWMGTFWEGSKSKCPREMRRRRAAVRGCPLVKVHFGSLNFVEEQTPLRCLDFANQLSIQMLLLTNLYK